MKMYEKIGEFTPDSLFVSPDFPVLREGIGLKAGQGVLKRGSLIMRGTDKAGYIAGTVVEVKEGEGDPATVSNMPMKIFGILADDVDTGADSNVDNIPAVAYQTGEYNRAAVIVGAGATIDTYEDDLKNAGIFLRNIQKYA